MNTLKTFTTFVMGIAALLSFYAYVSVPVVPAISVYMVGRLFSDGEKIKLRNILTLVLGIIAIALYGTNIFQMIIGYPNYGDIFPIVSDLITELAFVAAIVIVWNRNKEFSD